MMERRSAIVAAALTLIRAWLAAGRPEGGKTLGMFEAWARTIGGILDVAKIPGFLGNLEEFYQAADTDSAAWTAFVGEWLKAHGKNEVKVSDLWSLAVEAGIELGDKSDQSQKIRLGKLLHDARDRTFAFGDEQYLRLEVGGEKKNTKLWQLVLQNKEGV
jgi:putative DNA primase/helicase